MAQFSIPFTYYKETSVFFSENQTATQYTTHSAKNRVAVKCQTVAKMSEYRCFDCQVYQDFIS